MIQISLPSKPQKTVLSATFEIEFDRIYTIELSKVLCNDSEPKYEVRIIPDGTILSEEVVEVIVATIMSAAKKQGVFN